MLYEAIPALVTPKPPVPAVAKLMLSWLVLSLDQTDFVTSFTAFAANINNTGPGLGMVGPVGNYSEFSILKIQASY